MTSKLQKIQWMKYQKPIQNCSKFLRRRVTVFFKFYRHKLTKLTSRLYSIHYSNFEWVNATFMLVKFEILQYHWRNDNFLFMAKGSKRADTAPNDKCLPPPVGTSNLRDSGSCPLGPHTQRSKGCLILQPWQILLYLISNKVLKWDLDGLLLLIITNCFLACSVSWLFMRFSRIMESALLCLMLYLCFTPKSFQYLT